MRTHFKRMENWSVDIRGPQGAKILDSLQLTYELKPDIEILVEAWDGANQKDAVSAYFNELRNVERGAGLVGFIGHNALMDVSVPNVPVSPEIQTANHEAKRKGIVIACSSASYFNPHHKSLGVESYVMTKGLMAPEAYVVQGILESWLAGGSSNQARAAAAKQYANYQKIPLRNANWLFGVKK